MGRTYKVGEIEISQEYRQAWKNLSESCESFTAHIAEHEEEGTLFTEDDRVRISYKGESIYIPMNYVLMEKLYDLLHSEKESVKGLF